MVTPTFCISLNFFPKSLGIIDTEGKKIIIIIIIILHFIVTADNPQLIHNTLPRRTAPIQSNMKNQL